MVFDGVDDDDVDSCVDVIGDDDIDSDDVRGIVWERERNVGYTAVGYVKDLPILWYFSFIFYFKTFCKKSYLISILLKRIKLNGNLTF